LFGTLADFGGQAGGKLFEVLTQHFGLARVLLKNLPAIKIPQRALQSEPIKAVQDSHDILSMLCYKRVQGVVSGRRRFLLHETVLLHEPRPVSSIFHIQCSVARGRTTKFFVSFVSFV
jgi:hypothetical protein